jgi:hypothetical protein
VSIAVALLQLEVVFLIILVLFFVVAGLVLAGAFVAAARRNPHRPGVREGEGRREREDEERRKKGTRPDQRGE